MLFQCISSISSIFRPFWLLPRFPQVRTISAPRPAARDAKDSARNGSKIAMKSNRKWGNPAGNLLELSCHNQLILILPLHLNCIFAGGYSAPASGRNLASEKFYLAFSGGRAGRRAGNRQPVLVDLCGNVWAPNRNVLGVVPVTRPNFVHPPSSPWRVPGSWQSNESHHESITLAFFSFNMFSENKIPIQTT